MSSAPDRPTRRERARLTGQTWTATVAAAIFVVSALALSFLPIPYVVWSPGGAHDLLGSIAVDGRQTHVIDVSGVKDYGTHGELDLLTIAESRHDSLVSLPEALLAHWRPQRDVLPRDLLYPPGLTGEQVEQQDARLMDTSQEDAVIAAMRAAGRPIRERPRVTLVVATGPAHGLLQPGDFIATVDGQPVTSPEQTRALIARKTVGDHVTIGYLRDGAPGTASIELVEANRQDQAPVIGVRIDRGYSHDARVHFNVDSAIGGPSGGLVFALGVYDRVTPGDLLAGRHVAGTGRITSKGEVGAIGGIQEKLGAAERAGATIFLVPAANCADLAGARTSLRIVRVETLQGAIDALTRLNNPATAQGVPTCP